MPLSLIFNQEVHDFNYEKIGEKAWNFSCGDMFMGQLFKVGKSWSGVAWHPLHPKRLRLGKGLRTRYDACEFILRTNGYWSESYETICDHPKPNRGS